jgi:hypothetical protein
MSRAASCFLLQASVELARVYKEQYKAAKEQLAQQPRSKQFDFDEQVGAWIGFGFSDCTRVSRVFHSMIVYAQAGVCINAKLVLQAVHSAALHMT